MNLTYLVLDGTVTHEGKLYFYEAGQAFYSEYAFINQILDRPMDSVLIEDLLEQCEALAAPIVLLDSPVRYAHPRIQYANLDEFIYLIMHQRIVLEDEIMISPVADGLMADIERFQPFFHGSVMDAQGEINQAITLKSVFYKYISAVAAHTLPTTIENATVDQLRGIEGDRIVVKPQHGTRSALVNICDKKDFMPLDVPYFVQAYHAHPEFDKIRWVYRINDSTATCLKTYAFRGVTPPDVVPYHCDITHPELDDVVLRFVKQARLGL